MKWSITFPGCELPRQRRTGKTNSPRSDHGVSYRYAHQTRGAAATHSVFDAWPEFKPHEVQLCTVQNCRLLPPTTTSFVFKHDNASGVGSSIKPSHALRPEHWRLSRPDRRPAPRLSQRLRAMLSVDITKFNLLCFTPCFLVVTMAA